MGNRTMATKIEQIMQASDEKLSRELQAQFNSEAEYEAALEEQQRLAVANAFEVSTQEVIMAHDAKIAQKLMTQENVQLHKDERLRKEQIERDSQLAQKFSSEQEEPVGRKKAIRNL